MSIISKLQNMWKMMNETQKSVFKRIAVAILLTVLVIAWAIHLINKPSTSTGTVIEAPPSKEVKHLPKVPVQTKKPVKVYAGGKAIKHDVGLSADIVQSDNLQVIDSVKVEGDQPHTVTTLIDLDTGDTRTFIRTDPKPWLAWDDHGALGFYGGIKNGGQILRLSARQGLFSIKDVHVVALANLDSTGTGLDYAVVLGAEYRW